MPGSPENLPTLEEMLGLPNREVTPVEKEDLGLSGLFWLPPLAPLSLTGQSVCYLQRGCYLGASMLDPIKQCRVRNLIAIVT